MILGQTEWDWSSKETPNQQRARLVTRFIDLPHSPMEWAEILLGDLSTLRMPTTGEIDLILRPNRPDVLR